MLLSLCATELQKRADRADQSVLFYLAGANFWEKHAKNCAILCTFVYFLCIFGANFFGGGNWSVLIFTPFATMPKSEQLKTFMVRDCESQFVTPFFPLSCDAAVVVDM